MTDEPWTSIAIHRDVLDHLKEYKKNFPRFSYGQVIESLLQRYSLDSYINDEISKLTTTIGNELSETKNEIRDLKHHVSLIQEILFVKSKD